MKNYMAISSIDARYLNKTEWNLNKTLLCNINIFITHSKLIWHYIHTRIYIKIENNVKSFKNFEILYVQSQSCIIIWNMLLKKKLRAYWNVRKLKNSFKRAELSNDNNYSALDVYQDKQYTNL